MEVVSCITVYEVHGAWDSDEGTLRRVGTQVRMAAFDLAGVVIGPVSGNNMMWMF